MPLRPNVTTLAALGLVAALGMGSALALGTPGVAPAQALELELELNLKLDARTLRERRAAAILASDRITLDRRQPCDSPPGVCVEHDGATPYDNMVDTAQGLPARTSPWADAG